MPDPLWTALVKLDALDPEGVEFGYICVRAQNKSQAQTKVELLKHQQVKILEIKKDDA